MSDHLTSNYWTQMIIQILDQNHPKISVRNSETVNILNFIIGLIRSRRIALLGSPTLFFFCLYQIQGNNISVTLNLVCQQLLSEYFEDEVSGFDLKIKLRSLLDNLNIVSRIENLLLNDKSHRLEFSTLTTEIFESPADNA